MSAPNLIVTIATRYLEALTCGSLDYCDGRNGHKSRAEAAAALFDSVVETSTPGYYLVHSEESPRRGYMVHALSPDLSCECDDYQNFKLHLCKHLGAAVLYHTVKEVLAEAHDDEPEPEQAPAWVAAFANERG